MVNSIVLLQDSGCVTFLSGIKKTEPKVFFTISPNPSAGNFTLQFSSQIQSGVLQLFSVLGNSIYAGEVANQSKIEINLAPISPGIYFLKLKTESAESAEWVQKISITK